MLHSSFAAELGRDIDRASTRVDTARQAFVRAMADGTYTHKNAAAREYVLAVHGAVRATAADAKFAASEKEKTLQNDEVALLGKLYMVAISPLHKGHKLCVSWAQELACRMYSVMMSGGPDAVPWCAVNVVQAKTLLMRRHANVDRLPRTQLTRNFVCASGSVRLPTTQAPRHRAPSSVRTVRCTPLAHDTTRS